MNRNRYTKLLEAALSKSYRPAALFLLFSAPAVIGFHFILRLAEIDLLTLNAKELKPFEQSEHGTVLQVAIAWLGAFVGLGTFFLNRAQKQNQFDEQQQNEEYRDILNRLSDRDNPNLRISAALRLAEIGMRHKPGKAQKKFESNYPFFRKVAAQLAVALSMESDSQVRDGIVNAIRALSQFDDSTTNQLGIILAIEIAAANRLAFKRFREVFAEVLASSTSQEEAIRETEPLFASCCNGLSAQHCLLHIAQRNDIRARVEQLVPDRSAHRAAQIAIDEAMKIRIELLVDQLANCRDSLSTCLSGLSDPLYFKSDLDLNNVFLVGSNLRDIELTGYNLTGSDLQFAKLDSVYINDANINLCNFDNSVFENCRIQNCKLWSSTFNNATFKNSGVTDSDLELAIFRGAMFKDHSFRHTNCSDASFDGSTWSNVDIEGAIFERVNLVGSRLGNLGDNLFKVKQEPRFKGSGWFKADFTTAEQDKVNVKLVRWLHERDPIPATVESGLWKHLRGVHPRSGEE